MSGIEIRPLSGALGAEVLGCDLAGGAAADLAAVREAFLRYEVVAVRDQALTPAQHKAFSRHFGALLPVPFVATLAEHPEIIAVVKEADERTEEVFGGTWHSDFSFLPVPPLASCLYAREVPPVGGDTLFASMTRAYATLSDGMQALLRRLRVLHSGKRSYGTQGRFASDQLASIPVQADAAGDAEVAHPVVLAIPETGQRALFVNDVYAIRFAEMTEEESAPLLAWLCAHARRTEHMCRVSWAPGTLTLWDNRRVMHYAVNDYDGHRREMHRVTIAGQPLVAAEPPGGPERTATEL